MQIKETMQRYGYTPTSLAKKMGVYASTVIRLMEGNPTVDKLDELARWIGCGRWEFFLDEIRAAGFDIVKTQPEQPEQSASEKQSQESTNENPQPSAIGQQAIVCPHCHQALVVNIASYEQK